MGEDQGPGSQLRDKRAAGLGEPAMEAFSVLGGVCAGSEVWPPAHARHLRSQRGARADLHLWCIDLGVLAQEGRVHVAGRLLEGEWRLRGGPEWGWEVGREKAGGGAGGEGAAVGVKASG